MCGEEKTLEKEMQDLNAERSRTAGQFENIISHLWNERPLQLEGWMNNIQRGGADGYAEADIWRSYNRDGKVSDIDVAYVKAFTAIGHQLAYLKQRIEKLEE